METSVDYLESQRTLLEGLTIQMFLASGRRDLLTGLVLIELPGGSVWR
jgi:hypothetical protein